jgi:hypothetical protein
MDEEMFKSPCFNVRRLQISDSPIEPYTIQTLKHTHMKIRAPVVRSPGFIPTGSYATDEHYPWPFQTTPSFLSLLLSHPCFPLLVIKTRCLLYIKSIEQCIPAMLITANAPLPAGLHIVDFPKGCCRRRVTNWVSRISLGNWKF